MNFQLVAFVETFELAASLPKRMGLFKPAGDGLLSLPARGARANADDPDDDLGFVIYKTVASWPELKIMLGRIKRIGEAAGGIEFGRIGIELLPAGACLPWTDDDSAYAARFARALLPLRVNPGVRVHSGLESWSPAIGYLTVCERRVRGSAINLGEHPAIWLAVDFRKKDEP